MSGTSSLPGTGPYLHSLRQLRGKWNVFFFLSPVYACSAVSNSVTPRTVARQAPLSMGFSRQEYWSGWPCPSPGDLPDPGIEARWVSCIAGWFFTAEPQWVWLPSATCAWITYFGVAPSAPPQGRPSHLAQWGDSGSASFCKRPATQMRGGCFWRCLFTHWFHQGLLVFTDQGLTAGDWGNCILFPPLTPTLSLTPHVPFLQPESR